MSHDTSTITLAATYDSFADAEADYKAVKALYRDAGMLDTFDAAVITRKDDGKVKIVKEREEPARHGGAAGAVIGLAVGTIVALFPGAAVGAALTVGTGGGAVVGAVAGHASEGLSRKGLKKLGELLDEGESGLVVVASVDWTSRIEGSMSHAAKSMHETIKSDKKEVRKDIEDAQRVGASAA
jgi:uncharacterized membrane protein